MLGKPAALSLVPALGPDGESTRDPRLVPPATISAKIAVTPVTPTAWRPAASRSVTRLSDAPEAHLLPNRASFLLQRVQRFLGDLRQPLLELPDE
jgi:hypothetical protein